MFMGLGCACLLALGASIAPRLIFILMWIFGPRINVVFAGNWIWPLLGVIFIPYTTIMYVLVWTPGGIAGWDWLWVGLGLMLDVMKWGQLYENRNATPYYGTNDMAP